MKKQTDQEAEPENDKKTARLKIVIILLAILLAFSAGGLAAKYVYRQFFAPTRATVTVPDNLIGGESAPPGDNPSSSAPPVSQQRESESSSGQTPSAGARTGSGSGAERPQAPRLELYEGKPGDNERFEARDLFPGDSVTTYFCIKAYHSADIALFFRADVIEQTKALGDVLHIKVTHMETGKVLCDAPFSAIDGRAFPERLEKDAQGETTAYYRIDVSLDTSAGNAYQAALLKADFEWYVKDEGGLTPPPTGDTTAVLWSVLALSSLLLVLLLLKRGKGDKRHGTGQ